MSVYLSTSPSSFPRRILAPAAAFLLLGLLACGGAASENPSASSNQTISYSNPSGTGYRLLKSDSSTATRLVLNLVGPQGTAIKGGLFTLNADPAKVAWTSAGGSDAYIKEGSALNLGDGVKLLKSRVSGSSLEAAIYQKGSTPAATLGTSAILSAALDLKPGAAKGAVALACPSAQILDASGNTQTVTVSVGSLAIQ